MKKISCIVLGLVACTAIFQVSAVKLKLNHNDDRTYNELLPDTIRSCTGQYLTTDGSTISFTSDKKQASDFEVEEAIRTMFGTAYHRITYQKNKALFWDQEQKKFTLISMVEAPLKDQLQWHTFLKCLCSSIMFVTATGYFIEVKVTK